MNKDSRFEKFARWISKITGRSFAFLVAFGVILLWAISGPFFQFSNTWQLVINSTTTIITFLMVFIIQNTQNRDTEAMQLKLDELIRISSGKNTLLDLEELSQSDLDEKQKEYIKLAEAARKEEAQKAEKAKRAKKAG